MVDPHATLDRVLSQTVSGPSRASTTYYVYGLGLIGEETSGAYTTYHFDMRGSTVALTDINADNRLATVNGTAVTFDADANMLSGPAPGTLTNTGYSYNARNQVIEAGGFAYTYGVLGNRIAVRSPFNTFTTFVVDPHAALDRVLSRTVSGSSGASTSYYVYGLGLIGEETNGVYTAYHFDPRGSTVALTDINGNVTDTFSYGPSGELNNHTGFSTTPFQFNGQFGVQTDPNGLLYMRARYYNPTIKRFVNQDTLLGSLDPGISLNRFAYVNANPVDGIDPTGRVNLLVSHPVAAGASHAYILVMPDTPNAFTDNPFIRKMGMTTISASPSGNALQTAFGESYLNSIPNQDIKSAMQNSMVITFPPGLSDDDLSRALLAADSNYQHYSNNTIYYPFIGPPTPDLQDYNSNSYITGILNFVGVDGEADKVAVTRRRGKSFCTGNPDRFTRMG